MTSFVGKLSAYAEKKYKAPPEHLWLRYPGYTVFRHGDNQKWFALIMDVPGSRLGLSGGEPVDVLNVKMGSPLLADFLVQREGFFRGYHIGRGNWISILLDGTVPFDEVCRWMDESYLATASKETRHRMRPPKEWLIPANPSYYDVEAAFQRSEEINWKQGSGIKAGDTVFMYVAAPVSVILYQCRVTEADLPPRAEGGKASVKRLMRIRLLKRYPPDRFTFETLGKEYGIFAVRGPRGIPDSLSEALK